MEQYNSFLTINEGDLNSTHYLHRNFEKMSKFAGVFWGML